MSVEDFLGERGFRLTRYLRRIPSGLLEASSQLPTVEHIVFKCSLLKELVMGGRTKFGASCTKINFLLLKPLNYKPYRAMSNLYRSDFVKTTVGLPSFIDILVSTECMDFSLIEFGISRECGRRPMSIKPPGFEHSDEVFLAWRQHERRLWVVHGSIYHIQ